jgi:hypothetical protein
VGYSDCTCNNNYPNGRIPEYDPNCPRHGDGWVIKGGKTVRGPNSRPLPKIGKKG